ncbi:MAG: primase-like DNA-binding domain-containing protein [Rhodomicrobium sp.]
MTHASMRNTKAATVKNQVSPAGTVSGTVWLDVVPVALRLTIAALPLYPAIRINLDASAGQGSTWAVVAIGFVVFGAVCIENAVHSMRSKGVVVGMLWATLGAGFLALNMMNALANIAAHSDSSRDSSRARIAAAGTVSERQSQLSQRRAEQAKVAGEATPESIEADARALKAKEARLWNASFSCDPAWITKDATKEFCAEVATLEAKRAAAVKRDQLDAQLAALDAKAEAKGDTPSTIDSFADAMADGFAAFGYQVNETGKLAIVRARDWGKAIGVELLAGFGPSGLLLLLLRAGGHAPRIEAPAPQAKPAASARAKPAEKAKPEPLTTPEAAQAAPVAADPINSFMGRRLEKVEGERIDSGSIWTLWQADCAAHGIEPGTRDQFGRTLSKWLPKRKTGGVIFYMGVRIKPAEHAAHAALRLAVVNA